MLAPSPTVRTRRNYADVERAALEQRLAKAEARIFRLRALEDKYAEAARSPAIEARLQPYLDEVFARYKVKAPKYTFECHGRVCKIDSAEVERGDWMMPLQQTYPGRAIFRTMTFGPDGTFIELHDTDEIPSRYLDGIAQAALDAAQEPCELTATPPGDVVLAIQYDAPKHRITGALTGTLASHTSGRCIKRVLDETIARATPPPELTSSTKAPELRIELPLHGDE